MTKRRWRVVALIGAGLGLVSLLLWRTGWKSAQRSGTSLPADGSAVVMSAGTGSSMKRMKLTHGHWVETARGVSIELYSRPISACRESGDADMVLRLPDDVLEAAAGASIPATVENGKRDKEGAPRFDHANGGSLTRQTTSFALERIGGGRIRGELRSEGVMIYHSITKGPEISFRASGTIDVPICD